MRIVKTDGSLSMRGDALKSAIQEDKAKGLIPFYVSYIIDICYTSLEDDNYKR